MGQIFCAFFRTIRAFTREETWVSNVLHRLEFVADPSSRYWRATFPNSPLQPNPFAASRGIFWAATYTTCLRISRLMLPSLPETMVGESLSWSCMFSSDTRGSLLMASLDRYESISQTL